jgi:hypothetical protein
MILDFRDIRLDSWRWRPLLEKWGHLRVLINPAILKTATFLIVNGEPNSTVFFVRCDAGRNVYFDYAVTTRHSSQHPLVAIRFNRRYGGTEDLYFTPSDWFTHPSTDVAVMPLEIPLDAYDISFVDAREIADNREYINLPYSIRAQTGDGGGISGLPCGTGDEVFTIGLFGGHTGEKLAQPIARFGHIALNPAKGERIFAEIERPVTPDDPPELTPIDAFLVEIATWRGQSGSPVFIRPWPPTREERTKPTPLTSTYLIGMIQGFYPGEQDVKINGSDFTMGNLQMGIGIVIPAKDIMEVINRAYFERRAQAIKKKEQNPRIRPSSAAIKKEKDITKESFEDMLKRVSQKTSEPKS